nr:MAG TPA: hypothetical protein [Caudoviricetes sp.]
MSNDRIHINFTVYVCGYYVKINNMKIFLKW